MFNMGMTEILLIGAIALVVIGPKRLPEVARKFGKILREIKKTTNGFKANLNEEFHKQVGPEAIDLANMAKDLRGGIKNPMDIAEALENAAGVLEKSGELPKVGKATQAGGPQNNQALAPEPEKEQPQAAEPAYAAKAEEPAIETTTTAPTKPVATRAPGHTAPILPPIDNSK